MTTVGDWLENSSKLLTKAGIKSARIDSLIFLEDTLNKNRAHILAHLEQTLYPNEINLLNDMIAQRQAHIPLAYIRNHIEFYGRKFYVNDNVLVPRPESESIITILKPTYELLIKHHINKLSLIDIGSGSGVLGITASLELELDKISLLDVSKESLEVAKQNSKALKVSSTLINRNLHNFYNNDYDIFLCNLPYVPNDYAINLDAKHEPTIAIFGGPDGLDLYRILFNNMMKSTKKPLLVITESLSFQHKTLSKIAHEAGYKMIKSEGLAMAFILNAEVEHFI